MAKAKTTRKKKTPAQRRAIALRNLAKARAALKKKGPKKSAKKTTTRRRKTTAKKSAKKTTTRRRKTTAKKSSAAKVTKKLKRGAGYSSLNTLTVTPDQARALGSLMRSHWCKAKGKGKTVCVTKRGVVKAVITHGG